MGGLRSDVAYGGFAGSYGGEVVVEKVGPAGGEVVPGDGYQIESGSVGVVDGC